MPFRADRPLQLAPATVLDYRALARRRLPRQLFDYIDGGAYEETTMRANVRDLEEVLLRQVVMHDVSVRDQAVEVLGQRLALPVIMAPVGLGVIKADLDVALALTGRTSIVDVDRSALYQALSPVTASSTSPP
ncbi:MAG: alpha-hydroxy-acid oxidizing protein [Solirubrobacteraceae bacterium]|jgi:L-lactate dehydrogenase (cytochrome)